MDAILTKINKLLTLGERAGTEAEAAAAMQKVHELLAKHNLSLNDVKDAPEKEEDYIQDETATAAKQPWQVYIWGAIAKLYFCKHLTRTGGTGGTRHLLIGKPSNIAVAKYVASYIVRTGEVLALQAAAGSDSPRTFRNSFKKGFACRIHARVEEEIKKAKAGNLTDSTTGTALIVSPLYDKTAREIDRFILDQNMKIRRSTGRATVSDAAGYLAGRDAAGSVSLRSNGLGQRPRATIGHG